MEKNFHLYGWIPGRYLRIAELFDECEEGNWNKTEVLNSGKLEVEFSNGYGFALSGFPDPLEKWKNFQPRSIERGNPLTGEGRKERGRRGKNEISNGAKVEKSKGNGKKFVIARENSSEFDKNLPGTSIGPDILGKLRVPCTGFSPAGARKRQQRGGGKTLLRAITNLGSQLAPSRWRGRPANCNRSPHQIATAPATVKMALFCTHAGI